MPATVLPPAASFEEAASIQRSWGDHYPALLKEYPEKYIAVDPSTWKVVAVNSDLAMLAYELRDLGLDPRTDVAIQFISTKSATLIL